MSFVSDIVDILPILIIGLFVLLQSIVLVSWFSSYKNQERFKGPIGFFRYYIWFLKELIRAIKYEEEPPPPK